MSAADRAIGIANQATKLVLEAHIRACRRHNIAAKACIVEGRREESLSHRAIALEHSLMGGETE